MWEGPTFALFLSNYPRRASKESVLCAIQHEVQQECNARPTFLDHVAVADGLRVTLPNQAQCDAVWAVNGRLVLNYPLWIIRFPSKRLGVLTHPLSEIFQENSADGVVDLSNLAAKFADTGADPWQANFKDIDFVEFLLFRLGSEARDDRFLVQALVLGGNNINKALGAWSPFFHFLPNLRLIDLRGNKVRGPVSFPEWPRLEVRW
jgi:hypothetical protein